jgi:hypothetical protein
MRKVVGGAVARVFLQQPGRIAAAWRQVRQAQARGAPETPHLIDALVEPFVREVGQALLGTPGSPWTRTRGLLRLSPGRGARGLYDEFAALRRCMTDALEVLGGGSEERRIISSALDDAVDSAVAMSQQLQDPSAEPPLFRFGGVVVELYEPALTAKLASVSGPAALH